MPNLTDVQIQNLAQVYLRSDSPDITSNLNTWLNIVQLKVCQAARWQFLLKSDSVALTVGTGVGPYTLTAAMIYPAKPGRGYPALEEGKWDQTYMYAAMAAGPPKVFVAVPGQPTQVLFYPTPDQAYTVTFPYYTLLADLPGTGSTNFLSQYFPMVLVRGIVIEGLIYLGALQDLQVQIPLFAQEMKALAEKNLSAEEAAAFEQRIYLAPTVSGAARGQ